MEIHRCTEKNKAGGRGLVGQSRHQSLYSKLPVFYLNFLSGPNSTLIGIIAAYPSTIIALYPTVTNST